MTRTALVTLLLGLLLALPAGRAAETPTATVARLNDALLEVMQQAEALGYQGRYDKLAPVLNETFDFPGMAKVTLGSEWNVISGAQQQAFTDAFTDYSIGVFAHRFNGYEGERFEILGEQAGRRGTVLVRNQIVKSDGEAIAINYLTQPQDDGGWRIVDTILGGVSSELAGRRKEYSGIIAKTGIISLIQALKDKTAAFAAE